MDYSLLFSGVVAISTVVYAILTWKLVDETKKTRTFHYTPYIVMNVYTGESNNKALFFDITNVGEGVAKNVTFNIKSQYSTIAYEDLRENLFFKNGIEYFQAKKSIKGFIGFIKRGLNEEDLKQLFIVEVYYEDIFGNKQLNTFKISLGEAQISGYIIDPPATYLGMISYRIKKLTQQIESLEKKLIK